MDLAGILISASCVLTTSALLVTVYGGSGMPRFFRKPQPKSEPHYQQSVEASALEDGKFPDVGDLNISLPAMSAMGDLNIALPVTQTVIGDIREAY